MTRIVRVIVFSLVLAVFTVGCGGGAQKGKNADFDRPKTPESKTG